MFFYCGKNDKYLYACVWIKTKVRSFAEVLLFLREGKRVPPRREDYVSAEGKRFGYSDMAFFKVRLLLLWYRTVPFLLIPIEEPFVSVSFFEENVRFP